MNWQPIETAPRDGTVVDLWFSDDGGGFREPDCWWDHAWLQMDDGMGWTVGEDPTHWMPRPAAPTL